MLIYFKSVVRIKKLKHEIILSQMIFVFDIGCSIYPNTPKQFTHNNEETS